MGSLNCPSCGAFKSASRELCWKCREVKDLKAEVESLKERLSIIEPVDFEKEKFELVTDTTLLECSFPVAVKKTKALLALGIEGIRIVKKD